MANNKKMLAAVIYEAGQGIAADRLLTNLADDLQVEGYVLAGTVQRSAERADRCACDMIVRDLSTNTEVLISEDRGPNARGCRLDPGILQALVGTTERALNGGADALIINKFGKQEAQGVGFRDVIGWAAMHGIPAVVGVNITYLESWRAFVDGLADELRPDVSSVRSWLKQRLDCQPARGSTRQSTHEEHGLAHEPL